MASQAKMAKTNKKNHPGRAGNWLKKGTNVKGTSFYVAGDRRELNRTTED